MGPSVTAPGTGREGEEFKRKSVQPAPLVSNGRQLAVEEARHSSHVLIAALRPRPRRAQRNRRLSEEPESCQAEVDTLAAGSLAPGDPIGALRCA